MRGTQVILIAIILLLVMSTNVSGQERDEDGLLRMSENDMTNLKNKYTGEASDYRFGEFEVTYYAPLDSTNNYDADENKRLGPENFSPVQWYKEDGNWVFSAATEYRRDIASGSLTDNSSNVTMRVESVEDNDDWKVYEIVFNGGTEISRDARRRVMPTRCDGDGMNYGGNPWVTGDGALSQEGIIAISKSDFDYGIKLVVEGYGEGVGQDVGGAITAGKLDLLLNNCEKALKGGREDTGVLFEREKAHISGTSVGNEHLERLFGGTPFIIPGNKSGVNFSGDSTGGSSEYVVAEYDTPFVDNEVSVWNVGVDERRLQSSMQGYYMGRHVTFVAVWINTAILNLSILGFGVFTLLWMLAGLAYIDIHFAQSWLGKVFSSKEDINFSNGGGGAVHLLKMTIIYMILVGLVASGFMVSLFIWVFMVLADMTAYLMGLGF